jgi:hypothetical protein
MQMIRYVASHCPLHDLARLLVVKDSWHPEQRYLAENMSQKEL